MSPHPHISENNGNYSRYLHQRWINLRGPWLYPPPFEAGRVDKGRLRRDFVEFGPAV
ncbi:hypothetical protein J25TS5_12420 [Paenibacillus faecis]|nr:hypothetical protein J25TS5_12420 [Paenibacillus faecis]